MPSVSEAQHNAMEAAAHGHSTLGIPKSVGEEFANADKDRKDSDTVDEAWVAPALDAVTEASEEAAPHELDVAKAIRDGALESPQKYENIHLFEVRITGTGTAYRPRYGEGVYRPPEHFLTDDFVERCYGLPLIFDHPDKGILNTEEYRERAIGSIILPYIKGDEVWGIAKVFDDDAAACMCTTHQSTSPAVVFRDAGSTETVELSDGSTVLIEGKPSYLDHLAICEAGVWDKGGEPTGVNNTGASQVDQEKEAQSWADACAKMDALQARLDAMEEKKEAKADSADEVMDSDKEEEKLDSEEEKKEEVKSDSSEEKKEEKKEEKAERADSVKLSALESELAALRKQLNVATQPLSYEERDAIAAAQKRADGLFAQFGMEAPAALPGEKSIAYRKRLAARIQKHSDAVKDVKLDSLDAASYAVIEEKIYADASAAARMPANRPAGHIHTRTEDFGGHTITHSEGDMDSWMSAFKDRPKFGFINKTQGSH